MATAAQLRTLRVMRRACLANLHAPLTLKHRSLAGSETTGSAGKNTILRARSGSKTVETTTDSQVWAVWQPLKIRGGSADGGDTAAGGQWTGRVLGQIPSLDIHANAITVNDADWLLMPDGSGFIKIENPALSADGSYYTFSGISQR